MTDLRLTIPLVPPSVNSYVRHARGRHYLTPEVKAFKDAIAILARGQQVIAKLYQVDIHVFYGKKERGDLDNRAKVVLDGLQAAGVIVSDSRVSALNMQKHKDWINPRTEIRVRAL